MHRLLIAGLFVSALMSAADRARGTFLVASRDLGDPNFAGTVVLLLNFDEEERAWNYRESAHRCSAVATFREYQTR